jgi:hypothetical protein
VVELRKLYGSGENVVVAIPRKWLRVMKWGKGMLLRLELRESTIVVERAHVEGERAYLARKL